MENLKNTDGKAVYADLRNDFMFKKAFGQKDIMIPFLNDIMKTDKIVDIEYRNVEQLGLERENRKVYYDIYCHCSDGKDFIVEMQCRSQKYYRERMIFYSMYPLQRQFMEAKRKFEEEHPNEPNAKFAFKYKLYPVYLISITDFCLDHREDWPEDKFISNFTTMEESTGELYCDTLNYIYIELPRFRKALEQNMENMEKWAYIFKNIANMREAPDEFSEKCFKKLFESAKIANFTTNEIETYLDQERMKYDYENVLEYAVEQGEARGREEGEAKGRAEGREEGRFEGLAEGEAKGETKKGLEIAKKLFAEGMDINFVSKVTSLSIKELSVLR